jgi:thymidylate synthase
VDHVDQAKEQIKRETLPLPELKINKELKSFEDILNLTIQDFELIGYESHEKIIATLHTGYKK